MTTANGFDRHARLIDLDDDILGVERDIAELDNELARYHHTEARGQELASQRDALAYALTELCDERDELQAGARAGVS